MFLSCLAGNFSMITKVIRGHNETNLVYISPQQRYLSLFGELRILGLLEFLEHVIIRFFGLCQHVRSLVGKPVNNGALTSASFRWSSANPDVSLLFAIDCPVHCGSANAA
jgi:hypothetical protein